MNADKASGNSRLVLVRHGETAGNSSIRYYGRTDVPLSDLGRRQMLAVRSVLTQCLDHGRDAAGLGPIFASPLSRACEGAIIIAGVAPILIGEFAEIDFGAFEGLTADEIQQRYPRDYAHWTGHRLDSGYAYPNGESRAAFTDRVERGIVRMLALINEAHGDSGGNAIVVAHRGVIRAITKRLANVTPVIELASIHSLIHGSWQTPWHPEFLDATGHLMDIEQSRSQ